MELETRATGEGAEKITLHFFCAFSRRACLTLLRRLTSLATIKRTKTPVLQAITNTEPQEGTGVNLHPLTVRRKSYLKANVSEVI